MIIEIPRGVIVLEGPDACGKTTLSKTILERHGGRYIHLRYQKDKTQLYNFGALRRALRFCQDQLVVIDRHWLSEEIYSAVYRNGDCDDGGARFSYGVLKALGAVYVMCLPSVESCVARHAAMHQTGRELYEADNRIGQVAEYYHRCLWGSSPSSSCNTWPTKLFIDELAKTGGLVKRCQGKVLLYDIDEDGKYLVDVVDAIVAKVMAPRCHDQFS